MKPPRVFRAVATVLVPAQALLSVPVYAESAIAEPEPFVAPSPSSSPVNRTAAASGRPPLFPVFTANPGDEEISRARVFGEPLLHMGPTSPEENRALANAMLAYLHAGAGEGTLPLEAFLKQFPASAWRASLLANLGTVYERTGHFGRAERALGEAWRLAQEKEDASTRAVGDQAMGELLDLHMQFGHLESLETLLDEVGGREPRGRAGQILRQARAAAWGLRNRHEDAIPSAKVALERVLHHERPDAPYDDRLDGLHASLEGASLSDMSAVAGELGLGMKMAQREGEAEIPTPAVIHLKTGHFA